MVAFKNPIVYVLTIPSGATTGTRIVIDGIAGTISVYDASNVKIAQMGDGIPLSVIEGNVTFNIQDNVNGNGFPGMQWTVPGGGDAYLNIITDGNGVPQIGVNSGAFVNAFGHTVRRTLLLSTAQASFYTLGPSGAEGPAFQIDDTAGQLQYYVTGATQGGGLAVTKTNIFAGVQAGAGFTDYMFAQSGSIKLASTIINLDSGPNASDAFLQVNGSGGHSMYLNLDNTTSPPRYISVTEGGGTGQPVLLVPNETWHTLTLVNGWAAGSTAGYFSGLRYRKDATGMVHLNGNITAPAAPAGTTITTLPTGYLPSNNIIPICFYGANTSKLAALVLTSAGSLQFAPDLGATGGGQLFVQQDYPAEF